MASVSMPCNWHIVYAIILIVPLTISVLHISKEFIYSNVVSKIKTETKTTMNFPAVTICNLNPVRCSELSKRPKLKKLLRNHQCFSSLDNYFSNQQIVKTSEKVLETNDDSNFGISKGDFGQNTSDSSQHSILSTEHAPLASEFLEEKLEDRISMGYSFNDLIVSCSFHGKKCDKSDFFHTIDKVFGNCYTFNSIYENKEHEIIYNPSKIFKIYSPGKLSGLEIVFNVNHSEYIPNKELETGIQMLIHDYRVLPYDLRSQGKSFSVGFHTSISLKEKQIKKINSFNQICWDKYEEDMLKNNKNSFLPNEMYVYDKCTIMKYQEYLKKKYNCQMKYTSGYSNSNQLDDCSEKYGQKFDDGFIIEDLYKNSEKCHEECEKLTHNSKFSYSKITFDKLIASTIWPSNFYVPHLKAIHNLKNDFKGEEFRHNFGKLSVYFNTFETLLYEETSRFTVHSLIGSYGGYAGLYVGISCFSIFIFIEEFLKKFRKNSSSKVEDESNSKEDETKFNN